MTDQSTTSRDEFDLHEVFFGQDEALRVGPGFRRN
jgi:hypothetical protein